MRQSRHRLPGVRAILVLKTSRTKATQASNTVLPSRPFGYAHLLLGCHLGQLLTGSFYQSYVFMTWTIDSEFVILRL